MALNLIREIMTMGGFDYNHFSYDFSKRTSSNLNLIYKFAKYQRNLKRTGMDAFDYFYGITSSTDEQKRWIKKTQDLLSFISSPDNEAFEITQLLLSMYGMLLIPYEKYSKDPALTRTRIKNALRRTTEYFQLHQKIMELKDTKKYKNTFHDSDSDIVYSFIHHIRNSISHEGVHFMPLTTGRVESITNVIFYDYDANKYSSFSESTEKFCADINKDLLRDILLWICNMYMKISKEFDKNDRDRYLQSINDCKQFLSSEM